MVRNGIFSENTCFVHLHLHVVLACTNYDTRGFETVVNKSEWLCACNDCTQRIFEEAQACRVDTKIIPPLSSICDVRSLYTHLCV